MVDAVRARRGNLSGGLRWTLPPPAPLPRFSFPPPVSMEVLGDDSDPTRPWMPDAPTTPYTPPTPPTAWVAAPPPWLEEEVTRARNAPTVRPPTLESRRLPAALHGFAAGLVFGAIGLVVLRGMSATPSTVNTEHRHAAGGAALTSVPATTSAAPSQAASSAATQTTRVVSAEDLPRASVRVEDLPAASVAPAPLARPYHRARR